MSKLKTLIKRIPVVKKYRIRKQKQYSKRMMFSADEVAQLEKNPQGIPDAVQRHIKNTLAISNDIETELDNLLLRSYLAGSGRISDELKTDILFWYFAYGFSFNEYLCYQFIDKTRDERMKFFSDRESVSLGYDMNDINNMMVFGDKMNTYNRFRSYFGRDAISLESASDYGKYQAFIAKHSSFVKKNVFKACGESIELIHVRESGKNERELFDYLISDGKVILEELVLQSEKTAVFNDSSVNTIRCITFNARQGITTPYCFMKIGRSGAFVDNGGAGGILVGINPDTGVLETDGVDEKGIRYTAHPDSNVAFTGYQLPQWDTMIRICKEMSFETPTVRLIGWDMAYTDNGWVVIEGNALTEVIGPQSTWLRGIRNEIKDFYTML